MIRTLVPQFITHEIGGEQFLDTIGQFITNDGEVFLGLDGLFDGLTDGDKCYLFHFQQFYCILEKYTIEKGIPFQFYIKDGIAKTYQGHTKKNDYFYPVIQGTSDQLEFDTTPIAKKVRIGYKGKEFQLIDVCQFIRDTPAWAMRISQDYLLEVHNTLVHIIDKMFTKTWHGEGHNSIAGMSRSIFNYPALCTSIVLDPERASYLAKIESAYAGGIYYLNPKLKEKRMERVVCYDQISAYPHQLIEKQFPNPHKAGVKVDGFEADDKEHLHFYHIRYLDARLKIGHFPSVFIQKNYSKWWGGNIDSNMVVKDYMGKDIPWGKVYKKKGLAHLVVDDEYGECMITSIDWKMLIRDYDIRTIGVDYSIRCQRVDGILYFKRLLAYFNKKQEAPKPSIERDVYKVLIDSFSGSLAMRTMIQRYCYPSLSGREATPKMAPSSVSPIDIAAFMTSYQRYEITEYALAAGYENVVSIDTDSVFTLGINEKLEACCGTKLGNMHLDKELFDCIWFGQKQYEGITRTGKMEVHITGLPAEVYKRDVKDYELVHPIFDKDMLLYKLMKTSYHLGK